MGNVQKPTDFGPKINMKLDETIALPRDVISAKKCYLCQNMLSVPPILVVSSEKEQYICGRCSNVNYTTYTRNRLFESIAHFMLFPCTYEKCTEVIPWGQIQLHEQQCRHRTIQCPVYYQNCADVVEIEQLEKHFKEKHIFNLKTGLECWPLNIKYHYVHLWVVDNLQFFVYILHFDQLYSTCVLSLDPLTKYKKYNLKLTALNGEDCVIVYQNQDIFSYNERQHCYRCVRGRCKIKYHPFSQDNKKSEEIDLNFTNRINKILVTTISASEGDLKYTIDLVPENEGKNEKKEIFEI